MRPMRDRPQPRRLLHAVIDGLGDEQLSSALAAGIAPTIAALLEAGAIRGRAISPYPSLTPVCLSTLATGVLPDVHRIPSLSWYHRGQRRFVEYGSSFSATSVEGARQTVEDVVFNLNHVHLAETPPTIFELVEQAGFEAASINQIVFRGAHRHTPKYPITGAARWYGQLEAVYGPRWFWYGELFGPWRPVIPQRGVKRPRDMSAARIARYLIRETDAAYVLFYLGEHDKKAHASGPGGVEEAVRTADRAIGRAIEAAGGLDRFLSEWAIIVCADHGQVDVARDRHHTWEEVFDDLELFRGARQHDSRRRPVTQVRRRTAVTRHPQVAISPSNRCAMLYRLDDSAPQLQELAERAVAEDAADVVSYVDDGSIIVLRGDGRLVLTPDVDGLRPLPSGDVDLHRGERRWALEGDLDVLDLAVDDAGHVSYGAYPDAIARLAAAHDCVNSGDVFISAAAGTEYTDIGGTAHAGGSHGSLHGADSTAAFLAHGLGVGDVLQPGMTIRLADIYGLVGAHFGLLPASAFTAGGLIRGGYD